MYVRVQRKQTVQVLCCPNFDTEAVALWPVLTLTINGLELWHSALFVCCTLYVIGYS